MRKALIALAKRKVYQQQYYKEYWKRPEVKTRRNARRTRKIIWTSYLWWIKKTYNLTEFEYLSMLWKSKGRCFNPACGQLGNELPSGLSVDHDHKTGRVRGLLCPSCNFALGQLKENTMLIDGLKRYMEFVI